MTKQLYQHSAIVLGTEVNGLAVIRSLGRLGVRCGAVTATTRGDHAHHSRYLAHLELLDSANSDVEIIDAMRRLARRLALGQPVVIPTTDRFSECLSRNRQNLESEFLLCCPDLDLCDIFLDKWKTARICNEHDIRIPHTVCPTTTEDVSDIAQSLTFPVIVKPRYTFGTGFPGKNAVFSDIRSLEAFFARAELLGRCVIQQIIPSGDGDIIVVASYSGDARLVKAIYSGRKIRQLLPDYGATCFGLSELHPALESSSRHFLNSIKYRGFAALEFARSRVDGKTYFIELNTRTYYHNQLFADAGIDLTQVGYLDKIGYDVASGDRQLRQRDGLFWLDFRRDFQSMRLKRKQGRISIFEWVLSIIRARSFAYWNWSDPLPFLAACIWRLGDLSRNMLRRVRYALEGWPRATDGGKR